MNKYSWFSTLEHSNKCKQKKIWYFLSWQRIDALASKYCCLRGSYKCVSISAFRDERASLCMLLVVEGNAAKTWHVSLVTDFSQEMLYSTPCSSWKWFKRLIAFRCDVIWVAGCFQTWCSVQAVKAFNLDLLFVHFYAHWSAYVQWNRTLWNCHYGKVFEKFWECQSN